MLSRNHRDSVHRTGGQNTLALKSTQLHDRACAVLHEADPAEFGHTVYASHAAVAGHGKLAS
jgi:hypothetical protein